MKRDAEEAEYEPPRSRPTSPPPPPSPPRLSALRASVQSPSQAFAFSPPRPLHSSFRDLRIGPLHGEESFGFGSPTLSLSPALHFGQAPTPSSDFSGRNYKTRRCRHFDAGRCRLEELCNFAHGEEDVRLCGERELHLDLLTHLKPIRVGGLSRASLEDNAHRAQLLTAHLEEFYASQKSCMEQLKFLAARLKSSARESGADEQIQLIEENIVKLIAGSLEYARTLKRVMNIQQSEAPLLPFESFCEAEKIVTGKQSEAIPVNAPEPKAARADKTVSPMKLQMLFILQKLRELHSESNPVFKEELRKARAALAHEKVLKASQLLQKILYHPGLEESLKQAHLKIIQEAKDVV